MIHQLLVTPYYFGMFLCKMKNFAITEDKKDYMVGDNVVLKEIRFDEKNDKGEYVAIKLTGREMYVKIKAILRNCIGVKEEYVILIFDNYECN